METESIGARFSRIESKLKRGKQRVHLIINARTFYYFGKFVIRGLMRPIGSGYIVIKKITFLNPRYPCPDNLHCTSLVSCKRPV